MGALGGVTDALPVAGVTSALGHAGASAGSLLGQLAQLEGLASYLPSLASVTPSYASYLNAADTQVPSAATSPSLAQLEALLGQLEGSTGTAASVPAALTAVPNPLSSLSIAEAEAYGLLPAGFLSNFNANVPAAIGNEFLVPATEFHRGKNETSTGEIPWGRNSSVPLGASDVSKSKAPQSTTVGHKDLEMSSSTATETATATTTASTTTSLDLGGPSSTSSMVLTADVPAYTGGAGSNDELLIGAFDDASTSSDNGTVESPQSVQETALWTIASSSSMANTASQATATVGEALGATGTTNRPFFNPPPPPPPPPLGVYWDSFPRPSLSLGGRRAAPRSADVPSSQLVHIGADASCLLS